MRLEKISEQSVKRTARVDGATIDVDRLIASASEFPEERVPAENLLDFGSHDRGWSTTEGDIIGPKQIIQLAEMHQADFEQMIGAQPTWKEHICRVRDADLDVPILITTEGSLIDGAHRVTKMLIEHRGDIVVRRVPVDILPNFTKEDSSQEQKAARIRVATVKDTKAIARIHRESVLATYVNKQEGVSREAMLEYLGDPAMAVLRWWNLLQPDDDEERTTVLVQGNDVIGFCRVHRESNVSKVDMFYLDPSMTGKGLGSGLLSESLQWLGDGYPIELEVVSYNDRVMKLYERFGFRRQGFSDPLELPNGKHIPLVKMVRGEAE